MRIRNNLRSDQCVTFSDGHSIHLSIGEFSRSLHITELNDGYLANAIKNRRVILAEDIPQEEPKKEPVLPIPTPGPIRNLEQEEKTKRVLKKLSAKDK